MLRNLLTGWKLQEVVRKIAPANASAFRPRVENLEERALLSADAVLDWNAILLEANRIDHTPEQFYLGDSQTPPPGAGALAQGGPTRTSRAFAIVQASMYDALESITHNYTPYLANFKGYTNADQRAAVASAAHDALVALYPQQKSTFDAALVSSLADILDGTAENRGVELGQKVAATILAARANDHADDPMSYTPKTGPGYHQVDPLHPGQPFLSPQWGNVTPFAIPSAGKFRSPPPPKLNSTAYTAAYYEVAALGGDGVTTPTLRTAEQTEIGTFWGYDGTPNLGTPPRLYNQIVRVIAEGQHNNMEQNARLFALVNISMADAGIQSWDTKYTFEFWRPIVGLRNGNLDGNSTTVGMPDWAPLGAPCTNCVGPGVLNFTPPFPAYTSGHATFGAAAFRSIADFYHTDNISFSFTSDEFNGVNKGSDGSVRPVTTRSFTSLSQAAEENGQSRMYLGIHWSFDKTQGITAGNRIADYVASHILRPVNSNRIIGRVYLDRNQNSVYEAAIDRPLAGITVTLRNSVGTIVATALTAPDGSYQFANLPVGRYTVTETQPTGFGSSQVRFNVRTVAMTRTSVATNQNFGDTLGNISGKVYRDNNLNGVFNTNTANPDRGIRGITVTLTDMAGNPVLDAFGNAAGPVLTDVNGNYRFKDLLPGEYLVTETQPPLPTTDVTNGYYDGADNPGSLSPLTPPIWMPSATKNSLSLLLGINNTPTNQLSQIGRSYNFGEFRPGFITG